MTEAKKKSGFKPSQTNETRSDLQQTAAHPQSEDKQSPVSSDPSVPT